MILKSLIASSIVLLSSATANAAPYVFNRYIGNVYVRSGEIYKNANGGVTAKMRVNMPYCPVGYDLAGDIQFDYKADDGGYFRNYRFYVDGYEGQNNVETFVNVNGYDMSTSGLLTLTDNTYCR